MGAGVSAKGGKVGTGRSVSAGARGAAAAAASGSPGLGCGASAAGSGSRLTDSTGSSSGGSGTRLSCQPGDESYVSARYEHDSRCLWRASLGVGRIGLKKGVHGEAGCATR